MGTIGPLSPPNGQLVAELVQVAADANSLLEYLENANDVLPPFPKEELQEIAESLTYLDEGTTNGAAMVLWYASKRLPSLRREHLRYELSDQDESGTEYQTRGMSLDRRLIELMASTSTALDECRAQQAISVEAEPDTEVRVLRNQVAGDAESVARGSRNLSMHAMKASAGLAEIKEKTSARVDEISRGLTDLESLGRVVVTELSFSTVVWNWLQRIGARIADYPSLLTKAGHAIQKGADVAEVTWLRWENLWHEIASLVIKQARATGHDIEQLARKWQIGAQAAASEHDDDSSTSNADVRVENSIQDIDRRVRVRLAQAPTNSKRNRLRAVEELVLNDLHHPETILALAERASSDRSGKIRQVSAAALQTKIGKGIDRSVITELVQQYEDDPTARLADTIVRFFSMYPPCPEGEKVLYNFLLKVVNAGPSQTAYPYAIQSLLNHYGDFPEVMAIAENVIKKLRDYRVRSMTLSALTKTHPTSPETRSMVTWTLLECEDSQLVTRALRLAVIRREWSDWTLPLMLQLMKSHRDPKIKREAVRSLKALGWVDPEDDSHELLPEVDTFQFPAKQK